MSNPIFNDLKVKLTENITSFPHIYMFKFIIKADNKTMALVEAIFDNDAEFKQSQSSKGNYISITVRQVVMTIDEIITIYEKASEIKGVMSL